MVTYYGMMYDGPKFPPCSTPPSTSCLNRCTNFVIQAGNVPGVEWLLKYGVGLQSLSDLDHVPDQVWA